MMAASSKADALVLPEGFTLQASESLENYRILRGLGHGFATLDFEHRGFRLGIVYRGKLDSVGKYAGRGWEQRLVNDAVAVLKAIGA